MSLYHLGQFRALKLLISQLIIVLFSIGPWSSDFAKADPEQSLPFKSPVKLFPLPLPPPLLLNSVAQGDSLNRIPILNAQTYLSFFSHLTLIPEAYASTPLVGDSWLLFRKSIQEWSKQDSIKNSNDAALRAKVETLQLELTKTGSSDAKEIMKSYVSVLKHLFPEPNDPVSTKAQIYLDQVLGNKSASEINQAYTELALEYSKKLDESLDKQSTNIQELSSLSKSNSKNDTISRAYNRYISDYTEEVIAQDSPSDAGQAASTSRAQYNACRVPKKKK